MRFLQSRRHASVIPARVRLSSINVKAYSATKERAAAPQIAERHIDNVHASSRVYTRFSWPPGRVCRTCRGHSDIRVFKPPSMSTVTSLLLTAHHSPQK